MMCPDCGCDLKGTESICPNCGNVFKPWLYEKPVVRHDNRIDELKRQNALLEEQNRLLRSIDKSQKTTAAYTMLNVFWH